MNQPRVREMVCAAAGLAAFVVCILACTSFSPDDTKILYPSFDPASGALSVAVYDRPSKTSRQMFVPGYKGLNQDSKGGPLPRAQWVADGSRFVVTWTVNRDNDGDERSLCVFSLIPLDGREAVRTFHLDGLGKAAGVYAVPFPLIGTRVFVNRASEIVSLDVVTGEMERRPCEEDFHLLPAPLTNRLAFFCETNEVFACGFLDPASLKREWQLVGTNTQETVDIAFSPAGRKVAFLHESPPSVAICEVDKAPRRISLPADDKETLRLGNAVFSPRGDGIFVSFALEVEGTEGVSFGYLEISLGEGPPKRTTLMQNIVLESDREQAARFFQIGLSHDGQAVAVSSAPVALIAKNFPAEQNNLFIVDVPTGKVVKVPIPLPAQRMNLK